MEHCRKISFDYRTLPTITVSVEIKRVCVLVWENRILGSIMEGAMFKTY